MWRVDIRKADRVRPLVMYVFDVGEGGRIANVYGGFNPDKLRHVPVDADTP
jgi:hypothetical protein